MRRRYWKYGYRSIDEMNDTIFYCTEIDDIKKEFSLSDEELSTLFDHNKDLSDIILGQLSKNNCIRLNFIEYTFLFSINMRDIRYLIKDYMYENPNRSYPYAYKKIIGNYKSRYFNNKVSSKQLSYDVICPAYDKECIIREIVNHSADKRYSFYLPGDYIFDGDHYFYGDFRFYINLPVHATTTFRGDFMHVILPADIFGFCGHNGDIRCDFWFENDQLFHLSECGFLAKLHTEEYVTDELFQYINNEYHRIITKDGREITNIFKDYGTEIDNINYWCEWEDGSVTLNHKDNDHFIFIYDDTREGMHAFNKHNIETHKYKGLEIHSKPMYIHGGITLYSVKFPDGTMDVMKAQELAQYNEGDYKRMV